MTRIDHPEDDRTRHEYWESDNLDLPEGHRNRRPYYVCYSYGVFAEAFVPEQCKGCKNEVFYASAYPCNVCSRAHYNREMVIKWTF